MMTRAIFTLLVGIQFASPLAAQDIEGQSSQQLQESAVDAVNTDDSSRLLAVMKEMQRRQLLFFAGASEANCNREPDRSGILASKPFAWGFARKAYVTFLKQQQIENGTCGCLTQLMTFDEFAIDMTGAPAESMDEAQYEVLNSYQKDMGNQIAAAHRAHRAANCEAN